MAMRRAEGYETLLAATDGTERVAAAASHGAVFLGMPILIPLLVLLLYPAYRPSAYVKHQATQALLFHLMVTVLGGALATLVVLLFFGSLVASAMVEQWTAWLYAAWPVTLAAIVGGAIFTAWTIIIMLIATYKACMGEPYRMPLVGGFGVDG